MCFKYLTSSSSNLVYVDSTNFFFGKGWVHHSKEVVHYLITNMDNGISFFLVLALGIYLVGC
jgi:hypothetical protein